MTRYVGVTGKGVPPSPYIRSGAELAAALRAAAGLAEAVGDLYPVQLAATLHLDAMTGVGSPAQRRVAITELSQEMAGVGTEVVLADGDGLVVLRTADTPRRHGEIAVVASGLTTPENGDES